MSSCPNILLEATITVKNGRNSTRISYLAASHLAFVAKKHVCTKDVALMGGYKGLPDNFKHISPAD